MFRRSHWFAVVSLLVPSFGVVASTLAEDKSTAIPEHRVVLRISNSMLNSMLDNKQVDRTVDIREDILGTAIQGKGHVVGHTHVKMLESGDAATFKIIFNGEVHSRTVGHHGPAIIHSRAVTKFEATKLVVFEPGKGFTGEPVKIKSTTNSTLEGIDSTRKGWIGRMVLRRAAQQEAEQRPQVTEIARQRAERRIAAGFDKTSEQRLAKLNQNLDNRSLAMVGLRVDEKGEPNFTCCTSGNYLQIASKNCQGLAPIDLPSDKNVSATSAPIELWVHDSLVGEKLAAGIDMLTTHVGSSDLVTTIAAAAELIRSKSSPDTQEVAADTSSPFRVHKSGKWRVVQVAMPTADLTSLVKSIQANPSTKRQITVAKPVIDAVTEKVIPLVAKSPEATAVVATNARIWTSGKYTADAEFVALEAGVVRLRRTTGVNTSIPLEKLSQPDQLWIAQYLAQR
ncbi:SHD1 domain-containing protein [Anatilimnocola sp. NA78]|uniref:SHD1 domain-containing protein n=1 Tax=Anatilimnocola sp. NA78 TaxID=3415683 RepID=UPI003CE4D4AD